MANRQKDLFEMASQLKKKSFSGSFTSNSRAEDCMIIAYLTKTSYYEPSPFKEQEAYSADLLKQHGIASYLFFYETEAEKSKFLQSESAKNMISMQEVYPGAILLTYSNSQWVLFIKVGYHLTADLSILAPPLARNNLYNFKFNSDE